MTKVGLCDESDSGLVAAHEQTEKDGFNVVLTLLNSLAANYDGASYLTKTVAS